MCLVEKSPHSFWSSGRSPWSQNPSVLPLSTLRPAPTSCPAHEYHSHWSCPCAHRGSHWVGSQDTQFPTTRMAPHPELVPHGFPGSYFPGDIPHTHPATLNVRLFLLHPPVGFSTPL